MISSARNTIIITSGTLINGYSRYSRISKGTPHLWVPGKNREDGQGQPFLHCYRGYWVWKVHATSTIYDGFVNYQAADHIKPGKCIIIRKGHSKANYLHQCNHHPAKEDGRSEHGEQSQQREKHQAGWVGGIHNKIRRQDKSKDKAEVYNWWYFCEAVCGWSLSFQIPCCHFGWGALKVTLYWYLIRPVEEGSTLSERNTQTHYYECHSKH